MLCFLLCFSGVLFRAFVFFFFLVFFAPCWALFSDSLRFFSIAFDFFCDFFATFWGFLCDCLRLFATVCDCLRLFVRACVGFCGFAMLLLGSRGVATGFVLRVLFAVSGVGSGVFGGEDGLGTARLVRSS